MTFFENLFIYFMFCIISFEMSGQETGCLKGKIKENINHETIPGTVISVSNGNAATTDINGNYFIRLPIGWYKINITALGYQKIIREIEIKTNDTLVVDVEMETVNQVLNEVVISAGKFEQKLSDVTVSMEVIKPGLLENKAVATADQIVNQVPGVNVSDGQVSIRGGSGFSYGAGSRVLLLVDELPMISADAGDIKWNYLPIENLEQIEIIKGASSALFGSSALNGVINLRTAYAKDKPFTTVNTQYAVYGNPKRESLRWWNAKKFQDYENVSFSHSQKLGNLDLVIGGNAYNNDGFRMLETEKRGRANINLRYNFKNVPGLSVGINGNYMDVKGGLFFLWHNDSLAYTPRDSSIQLYNNIRYNIDPFIIYNTERYGRHSLRTRQFNTNNQNNKSQGANADLYYAEYQWQKRFQYQFTLTTGIVYMDQQVYSDSLYGRHSGHNRAVYVQMDKKIKKLTLSLGLRGEYFKVDTAQTKGNLFNNKINNLPFQPVMRGGLNYQLFEYTFLRSSFGQGYRFPSVAEKYVKTFVNSLNIFPNPQLQPEQGWCAELGIKQGFKIADFRGFVDVAEFWTEYKNMMDFVFMYDTSGKSKSIVTLSDLMKHAGFQSQNIGSARITGFDITLAGSGKIGVLNFTLLSGYTFTNPINPNFNSAKDTSGSLRGSNLLKYRSKTLFKNDVQIEYKKFSIGFSSRFNSYMANIDKRFEEPVIYENLNPNFPAFYNLPDWYVLPGLKKYRQKHNLGDWMSDLRIAVQLNKIAKASFLINNVFNHEYMSRPGFIEAPRTFIVQLLLKVN